MGLHENVENAAILINCMPQIMRATTDLEEHLVEMPGIDEFPGSSANAFGVSTAESFASCSDRLVGHGNAMLGHYSSASTLR